MLENVRRLVEAAGGSTDDLVKVEIVLANASDRAELNARWCDAFPDPSSRPARSVSIGSTNRPHILVQCQILAVVHSEDGENRG